MVRLPGGHRDTAGADIPPPPGSNTATDDSTPVPPLSGFERPIDTTFDSNDWRVKLQTQLAADIRKFAEDAGYPAFTMESWLRDQMDTLQKYLEPFVLTPEALHDISVGTPEGAGAISPTAVKLPFYNGLANPHIPEGLNAIYDMAKNWIGQTFPGFVGAAPSGGGGGGGGGGARQPTPGEIRQQFDLNMLTDQVQTMARQFLVEDIPDPRSIASAYVDAIVSSGGKQKIDFSTFVEGRLLKTARAAQVYRNKPEGIDHLQYIQPYAQAALGALGGNRGAGISQVVGEGAALGAAPGAFAERLKREDAVRNQSGFINGIEKRMSGISKVLRG